MQFFNRMEDFSVASSVVDSNTRGIGVRAMACQHQLPCRELKTHIARSVLPSEGWCTQQHALGV